MSDLTTSEYGELKTRRRQATQNGGLLSLLCHEAGIQAHTVYKVQSEDAHPESDHRWMVETGDNGSGIFTLVSYGADSDLAKLISLVRMGEGVEG